MREFTREIFQCESCEKEYEDRNSAVVCEKFCKLLECCPIDIFNDSVEKLPVEKKERVLEDFSSFFEKLKTGE